MKRLFRRPGPSLKNRTESIPISQHLALLSMRSVSRRHVRLQWTLRIFACFVGMLLIAVILPASPIRLMSGSGGGSAFINPICGTPAQVFARLRPGGTSTLPSNAELMRLPTPIQRPITTSLGATYDPMHHQLCVASAAALDAHFGAASSTLALTITGASSTSGGVNANVVGTILGGLMTSFLQWVRDSLQSILDAAVSFGFMLTTPRAITYEHPVVQHLEQWMLLLTDSALGLFLVIGGYKYMFGEYQSFRQFLPKLLVAAILANLGLPVLGQFIEVSNAVCGGILGVLRTAGLGNLNLPLGLINWVTAPEYLIIVYLIEFVGAILLSGQMLLRIAFLCLLLVTAPVGLFLCFGGSSVLPGAQHWGTLWAQAFIATLITQPIQLLCLGMGAALIGGFGHASISPIAILVGIAAIFLAGRVPDLLLSSVIRARVMSYESVNEMTQGVVNVAQTGAEMAALATA